MKEAFSRKNLWNRLGAPGRKIAGGILGLLPLEMVLGSRFRANHRLVNESQHWRAEEVLVWQTKALRDICALAAATPYYSAIWKARGVDWHDLGSPQSLLELPTIDKHTLNEHLNEMCVPDALNGSCDYVSTGGTSGTPLRFYIGRSRSDIEFAHIVAGWERVGFKLGMPLAVFRGRVVPPDNTGLRHEHDPLLRHHYYSNFHMSDENMRRYLEDVRRIGPCFLHVYPSSVFALARFMRRAGIRRLDNVRGILAESEIVYPEQRTLVEETFGVRYFSSYGLTEKLVAAAECEHSTDYHVWPTYGYCELIDADGRLVKEPGRVGEIVGTGFINRVVPFIRYRTGDFAVFAGDLCKGCGREQMILSSIKGHRVQESLVMRDGTAVGWTALNMHDDTFENVLRFQFYQDVPGRATLRIIPAQGFAEVDKARVLRNLGLKLAGQLDVAVELVADIPLSSTGKSIYVDQRIAGAAQS